MIGMGIGHHIDTGESETATHKDLGHFRQDVAIVRQAKLSKESKPPPQPMTFPSTHPPTKSTNKTQSEAVTFGNLALSTSWWKGPWSPNSLEWSLTCVETSLELLNISKRVFCHIGVHRVSHCVSHCLFGSLTPPPHRKCHLHRRPARSLAHGDSCASSDSPW